MRIWYNYTRISIMCALFVFLSTVPLAYSQGIAQDFALFVANNEFIQSVPLEYRNEYFLINDKNLTFGNAYRAVWIRKINGIIIDRNWFIIDIDGNSGEIINKEFLYTKNTSLFNTEYKLTKPQASISLGQYGRFLASSEHETVKFLGNPILIFINENPAWIALLDLDEGKNVILAEVAIGANDGALVSFNAPESDINIKNILLGIKSTEEITYVLSIAYFIIVYLAMSIGIGIFYLRRRNLNFLRPTRGKLLILTAIIILSLIPKIGYEIKTLSMSDRTTFNALSFNPIFHPILVLSSENIGIRVGTSMEVNHEINSFEILIFTFAWQKVLFILLAIIGELFYWYVLSSLIERLLKVKKLLD